MTFLDLFAGIGGFRRGLERSGHTCVGHVEIDKYANKSYMAMYGLETCPYGTGGPDANSCRMCRQEVREDCDGTGCGEKCKGEWYAKDIKQLTAGEIPKAEIWTFGFPCTDISISGRMAGLHGERSGLFFAVTGLLKGTAPEDKPRYLIIENVKHLVSNERGGDFTTVLFELWEAGYDCEWCVVNSKDHGVPQHRERVYLVGYPGGRGGRKIFPLGGANPTPVKRLLDGQQGKRVYDNTGTSITLTANGGGFAGRTGLYAVPVSPNKSITGEPGQADISAASDAGEQEEAVTVSDNRGQNHGQGENEASVKMPPCASFIDLSREPKFTELSRSIMAKQYAGITNHKGETSGIFICKGHPECVRAVLTPDRMEKRQNGRRFKEQGEPSFTLTCQDRHGILLCCMEEGLAIREAKKDGYTKAVHGDGINLSYPNSTVSRGRVGKQCVQTLLTGGSMGVLLCCRIRRLTPRECWRLQAFEDFLFDRAKAAGISDAQLYKQAGNAVTVNVVYEIGLKLAESGVADEVYSNGEILPCKEHFNSPQHAIDVIRRMLHKSGMIFDSAQTIVVGHLSNKIRITVMGDGVIDRDKGLSASIRIVNPRKLTKQQFVDYGTATAEMLDLLAACYCHGVSMCITGATSSGKTTLMSWILGQVPYNKRIVTLEQGCREFDLTAEDEAGNVLNNVVHLVTRFSDDPKQNITLVKLLETTLTINPDCVAVAEMKGAESMQAINAANTGHSVITTIHANSCADTYYRMVTLCKQSYDMDDSTLMGLATKAFPIVAFAKKLEDNSRRLMEISECEYLPDSTRPGESRQRMRTLYRFNITDNRIVEGKAKIIGHYEKVEPPSEGLLKRLRENGMSFKTQQQLFGI